MKIETIQDILPLTNLQKTMLFSMLIDNKSHSYFEQIRYKIQGMLEIELFKRAWSIVSENNDNLRTIFKWKGVKEPLQIILCKKTLPIQVIDLTHIEESDMKRTVVDVEEAEWKKRVDLTRDPFRITLCKLEENCYEMFLSTHHIIIDGWSNAILMKEFIEAYHSILYGYEIKVQKPSYKSYIEWNLRQNKQESLKYWRAYLNNYRTNMHVISKNRSKEACGFSSIRIEDRLVERIKIYAKDNEVTLAVMFYGVWALVQSKLQDELDVVFGITLSDRSNQIPNIEQGAGLFIKTLPLRINCSQAISVFDFFKQIQERMIQLTNYCNVDLSDIISNGIIDGEQISSVVVIQNYPLDSILKAQDSLNFRIQFIRSLYQMNMNLTLGIKMFDNYIDMDICYCKNVYHDKDIDTLRRQLTVIINSIFAPVCNNYSSAAQSISDVIPKKK